MFESLDEELNLCLLFMKNVRRIKLETLTKVLADVEKVPETDSTEDIIKNLLTGGQERFLVQTVTTGDVVFEENSFEEQAKLDDLIQLGKDLKVRVSVSVAACITSPDKYRGRVSVMLPLPNLPSTQTGLPVIVNAFFAVGDSR